MKGTNEELAARLSEINAQIDALKVEARAITTEQKNRAAPEAAKALLAGASDEVKAALKSQLG